MVIGFTGTHVGMTTAQKESVKKLLWLQTERDNTSVLEFHMGDCIGADAQAADIAWSLDYSIVAHPPVNDRNRYYWQRPGFGLVNQTYISLPPKPYITRDHDIVNASERMIATPAGIIEELRSGTWATIRYARKKKVPLSIVWPDGTISYEGF